MQAELDSRISGINYKYMYSIVKTYKKKKSEKTPKRENKLEKEPNPTSRNNNYT